MVWFIGVDAFLLGAELLTTYTSRVEDHVMQLEAGRGRGTSGWPHAGPG